MRQFLSSAQYHNKQAECALSRFEVEAATWRIVISLTALGFTQQQITDALRAHPDSAHWRSWRQVRYAVVSARAELETFIMEADRNGAGIKEKILAANITQLV